ncbi:MAG TPA: DUF4157 domain-containing protein [Allosphingosinicella sp.]|nr:DUF4157 domain-containing protein [Allosphingosinicella sp.]
MSRRVSIRRPRRSQTDAVSPVHQARATHRPAVGWNLESQVRAAEARGRPLRPAARQWFEARLGATLTDVRLHEGAEAETLAEALNARAFTHGRHVFLGPGEGDLRSAESRRLLAHELAHAVQQRGAAAPVIQRAPKPGPAKPQAAPGIISDLVTLMQLRLSMCQHPDSAALLERIDTDKVKIVLFDTAFDKWKYDDGREEEDELTGLRGNTDVAASTIRLRKGMSSADMINTLFHEMQHWGHFQDPQGPRGLESEIQARIATEQMAIDRGFPPTRASYRTADGKVDEAAIRKEINASSHYNPQGRKRIGRRYVGDLPVPGPWTCPPIGDFPDPGRFRNYA